MQAVRAAFAVLQNFRLLYKQYKSRSFPHFRPFPAVSARDHQKNNL